MIGWFHIISGYFEAVCLCLPMTCVCVSCRSEKARRSGESRIRSLCLGSGSLWWWQPGIHQHACKHVCRCSIWKIKPNTKCRQEWNRAASLKGLCHSLIILKLNWTAWPSFHSLTQSLIKKFYLPVKWWFLLCNVDFMVWGEAIGISLLIQLSWITCLFWCISFLSARSSASEMERWVEDIRMAIDLAEQSSSLNTDLLSTSLADNSKLSTVGLALTAKSILLPTQTSSSSSSPLSGNRKINTISHKPCV